MMILGVFTILKLQGGFTPLLKIATLGKVHGLFHKVGDLAGNFGIVQSIWSVGDVDPQYSGPFFSCRITSLLNEV